MKRLPLVVVLVVACLLLFAAPASADFPYAPQTNTAYIPHWSGGIDHGFWLSFVGGEAVENDGPINHDMNVVVTAEWFDTRLGATLVPAEWFHSLRVTGPKCFTISLARSPRYWSPAYQIDPVNDARQWARDWWVPLGKLPPGHYTISVREFVPHAFPTWQDPETGAYLPLAARSWSPRRT